MICYNNCGRDIQFKMYFKDPEQLQMIFGNLEEKNLFVMKYIQEVEQNIENLRQSFSQKKANLIEKEKQLRKNKLELEKTLQVSLYHSSVYYFTDM